MLEWKATSTYNELCTRDLSPCQESWALDIPGKQSIGSDLLLHHFFLPHNESNMSLCYLSYPVESELNDYSLTSI